MLVKDLEKINKDRWLDWDGVNWPVNTDRRSLNPKCHYEYQVMRGVVARRPNHPTTTPGSATACFRKCFMLVGFAGWLVSCCMEAGCARGMLN